MRLTRAVERLEASAAQAREAEPKGIGLVWTADDMRVEAEDLRPGEYIACDLVMREELDGAVSLGSCRERVTADVADLGAVYDSSGARIGRVTAIDGELVSWERLDPERVR